MSLGRRRLTRPSSPTGFTSFSPVGEHTSYLNFLRRLTMTKVYVGLLLFLLIALAINVLLIAAKAISVLIAVATITYFIWRKNYEPTNR